MRYSLIALGVMAAFAAGVVGARDDAIPAMNAVATVRGAEPQGRIGPVALLTRYLRARAAITNERPLVVICSSPLARLITPGVVDSLQRDVGLTDAIAVDTTCAPRAVLRKGTSWRPVAVIRDSIPQSGDQRLVAMIEHGNPPLLRTEVYSIVGATSAGLYTFVVSNFQSVQ